MKKLYTLVLFISVCFSGCDPLGIQPTTAVFEDQFWESPLLSRSFVNQFYLWAPTGANSYFQSEQWSDNAVGNMDSDHNVFRQVEFNDRRYDELNSAMINAPWGDGYKKIRQANLAIERIPTVPTILETEMHQLLGESYAFRAQFYFELERYWGALPIITKVMTVSDETMLPQNTREEVFTQILSDYDKALEHFGKITEKSTLGLMNANAVQVLKSRAALTAACAAEASISGIYDNLPGTAESKALYKFTKSADFYYNIAYLAAKAVLGKYDLDPNYKDLFNGQSGHTSVESIWPIMFADKTRVGFNPATYAMPAGRMYGATTDVKPSFDGHGNAYPTQELVNCYLQKDKTTKKWMQWWKTSQSQDMNVEIDANGGLSATSADYQTMYSDRDQRFYTTILYDGSYYAGIKVEKNLIGTWIDNSEPTLSEKYSALHTLFKGTEKLAISGSAKQTMTGYYPAKYVPGKFKTDGTVDKTQTSISYFMVRYAEVLLNYAEAAYKLGGKEVEVKDAINKIRNRAGLDNYDGSNGEALWEEYKLQRRIEFAFEVPGHRYFDLMRWSEAEGKTTISELNKPSTGMYIFRKGIESEEVEYNGYPASTTDAKYFTPHFEVRSIDNDYYERKFDDAVYYKLPFSRTTLESNLKFVQNPGWENKSYQ